MNSKHAERFTVVTEQDRRDVAVYDDIVDAQAHVQSAPGLVVKVSFADGTHLFI